jgi:phosphoribosylanthranilate isomerase
MSDTHKTKETTREEEQPDTALIDNQQQRTKKREKREQDWKATQTRHFELIQITHF